MIGLEKNTMVKIDYIGASFNRANDAPLRLADEGFASLREIVPQVLMRDQSPDLAQRIYRKTYRHGVHMPSGFSVFWGGQDTVLLEISGQGCQVLGNTRNHALRFIQSVNSFTFSFNKFTRIDICEDYGDNDLPHEVIWKWQPHQRIKSIESKDSQSGSTIYVGSRKSDRFCKVYRYYPPHPRSDSYRCEFQWNKRKAGAVVQALLSGHSPTRIYQGAMEATFLHGASTGASPVIVQGHHDRANSSTVNWFYKQVAPAIARLLDEGELTVEQVWEAIGERRDTGS